MKIATVIGATGYVGSQVVQCLLGKGYFVRCSSRAPAAAVWLKDICSASNKENVEIFQLDFNTKGPTNEKDLDLIMNGADAVFWCAGFETQAPETIEFMRNGALECIKSAKKHNVGVVVLTSSGGSTNPPGLSNTVPKNELLHWSDPVAQQDSKRYSPAAKTLMEIASLAEVGRDQANQVIDETKAANSPRLCIMNPNLILGPQLQPGPIKGNSLPWIVRILTKQTMNEIIPNDSMSIIDVRDLAELHVACVENAAASGRYFGVQRSWPWVEILTTFEKVYDKYSKPPKFKREANQETLFDTTRRDSLGVTLRPLQETLASLVAFLKERGAIP